METSFHTGVPMGTCIGKHDLKLGMDAKAHLEKAGIPLLLVVFQRRAHRATVTIDFVQDIDKAVRSFIELHPDFKLDEVHGTNIHFKQVTTFTNSLN